ncbi:MAG: phage tail sheath protein, partial [Fusobacteriaceae bacterium]
MGFTSEIIIEFKTLAKSLIERSARGIVYLIIDDDTKATEEYNEYSSIEEIKSTDWTADNYKTIQLAFTEGVNQPYKVFVRRKNADTVSEILIEMNGKKMTQLCYPECSEADDLSIRTWANGKLKDKDVVYVSEHGANTDSAAVVQVQNRTGKHVTFGTMTAGQIAVAIAGMIAGCPLTQSLTAMRLKNFISMDFFEPKDGYLTIKDFGDSKVKVDYGINSRTTFTEEWKSDTRKIKV